MFPNLFTYTPKVVWCRFNRMVACAHRVALAVLRGGQAASAESCTHPAKRDHRFPPPIAERQRLPNVRIDFQWPHFLNDCLVAILDFSVSGWHGFDSVTQVCFGISVSNLMCMSFVAVGRSLTIVSYVAFKMAALWFWTMPPSPRGRGYPSRSLIYNF